MPDLSPLILRIALPVPVPGLFDYLPLADSGPEPRPGMRVQVPFGHRVRVGMVVALARESDQEPARLNSDLELILWAADYYRQPPGEALFSALPARLRRADPTLEPRQSEWPGWRLTALGREQAPEARARRQAELHRLLGEHPDGLGEAAIRSRLGEIKTPLRALAERGWIEPCHLPRDEPAREMEAGPALNPRQIEAVAAVRAALGRFQPFLLEGVTGSGKTEVYIRLLITVLESGAPAPAPPGTAHSRPPGDPALGPQRH